MSRPSLRIVKTHISRPYISDQGLPLLAKRERAQYELLYERGRFEEQGESAKSATAGCFADVSLITSEVSKQTTTDVLFVNQRFRSTDTITIEGIGGNKKSGSWLMQRDGSATTKCSRSGASMDQIRTQ